MYTGFEDKVIVITGSSRGLGKALAIVFKSIGNQSLGRDAALQHLLPEMSEAHVAGAAARVGDDHDLLYAKLINCDDETAHGRIPRCRDDGAGVLDDLGIPVLKAQRFLQEH